MKKDLIIIVFLITLLGCKSGTLNQNKTPIARVYEKYLYLEDVQSIMPNNLSSADSIKKVQSYINMWAKNELLLKKAEMNLTTEQKDVEKQLAEYKAMLLIHAYKQKFISQKLDTNITVKDITEYYNKNANQFKLTSNVVKALFLKIPKDAPNLYQIQHWYKSVSARDSLDLEEYCKKYATKYSNFNQQWIYFSELAKELPRIVLDQEDLLKRNKYIEMEDNLYNYYVHVYEYRLKGDITPMVFVESNIQSILLNKKRENLINELENNVYREALNYKYMEIYNAE